MKVLVVIDSLGRSGAEQSLAASLPLMVAAGIEPVIVTLKRAAQGVQERVVQSGVRVRFLEALGRPARVRALRRVIREEAPDLVHSTLFEADLASRLARVGLRTPLLNSLVNTPYVPHRFRDPSLNPRKLRLVQVLDAVTAHLLVDHFHAITEAVKHAAVRDMLLPARKITVIERGRDLPAPTPEQRRRARERLGVAENTFLVLNTGRQCYQKGQTDLLEALPRLERPGLKVLVAGREGDMTARLRDLAARHELQQTVEFLGHRDDMPDLLAAADLFVFPSLFEGLGGAVLEAMASGLPIVASDIPALAEVVEADGNALLVPTRSPERLAEAIAFLRNNPERRRELGRRSRQRFEQHYRLETSVERQVELYKRLGPCA